jgi:hypothetical protein
MLNGRNLSYALHKYLRRGTARAPASRFRYEVITNAGLEHLLRPFVTLRLFVDCHQLSSHRMHEYPSACALLVTSYLLRR